MAVVALTVVGCLLFRHGSQGDRISAGVGMMKVRHKNSNKITGGWAAEVRQAVLLGCEVQVTTLLRWSAAHVA